MKIALVCDWLTGVGGGEKVLLELHKLYPDAPIYTSQYDPSKIDWFKKADVRTGRLQKFPTKFKRLLGPFRQWYFSHLDLSEYDLVISVTGAEAKAVKAKNGVHICYCHVPTQYYWGLYQEYLKNPGFGFFNPIIRFFFRLIVRPLRYADLKATKTVDHFITISKYAKRQIKTYYGRNAAIIHPPVEVNDFSAKKGISRAASGRRSSSPCQAPDSLGLPFSGAYYITTSRQANWKRIDLAVRACLMTQRKLLVIGDGPEHKKLVKLAKNSGLVEFLPVMKKRELAKYLSAAKGYLFPSYEPFGIAPVEALAAGCPVISYKEGGASDYVVNGKNGLMFDEQTAKSLAEAILKFEKLKFNRKSVSKSAEQFSTARFDREIKEYIKKHERSHVKKTRK